MKKGGARNIELVYDNYRSDECGVCCCSHTGRYLRCFIFESGYRYVFSCNQEDPVKETSLPIPVIYIYRQSWITDGLERPSEANITWKIGRRSTPNNSLSPFISFIHHLESIKSRSTRARSIMTRANTLTWGKAVINKQVGALLQWGLITLQENKTTDL